jgi:regulatory protein
MLPRLKRADRQIEAGESLSESDGARNPHRDRERSPAFFCSPYPVVAATSDRDAPDRTIRPSTDGRCGVAAPDSPGVATPGEKSMSVISGIVPVPRPAGRFALLVDGLEVAILSLDAIERLRLAVGRPVAGLEDQITREAAQLKTYDRALNLLAFRARSSSELARSMVKKGEEKTHVDWAISRLQEQGLLDDAAFARSFTRTKVLGGKQSRRRVQQDLGRKGVARSVADEAIATVFEEEEVDQRAIVEEAARKKLRSLAGLEPVVRRRRLYAFLARRGYDVDDIRQVMNAVGSALEAEDDSEVAPE